MKIMLTDTANERVQILIDFQLHLHDIGLIGNSAWSYELQAKRFVMGQMSEMRKDEKRQEPIYELSRAVYTEGKWFKEGERFQLAGLSLSTQTEHSPFHYNGGVIRLPNSAIRLIAKTSGVAKVGDMVVVLGNGDGNRFKIGSLVKAVDVSEHNVRAVDDSGSWHIAHHNYCVFKSTKYMVYDVFETYYNSEADDDYDVCLKSLTELVGSRAAEFIDDVNGLDRNSPKPWRKRVDEYIGKYID